MTCECFYIVEKGGLEDARECAAKIEEKAIEQREEVFAVYISRAKKDFYAWPDYDGRCGTFTVKAGTWLVFAQGKNYSMARLDVDYKMGFPNRNEHADFYDSFDKYIDDVEPCRYP